VTQSPLATLSTTFDRHAASILQRWTTQQIASLGRTGAISERELNAQCEEFLEKFRKALVQAGTTDIHGTAWSDVREQLSSISRSRALQGSTPSETAMFIFSLKQPLFAALRDDITDTDQLADVSWAATEVLDALGIFTTEVYQKGREAVIRRQQEDMLELSTPVVSLWDGILAIPVIGTLDSERTQVVMETLLQRIVQTEAEVAIIDITGVPTVDTLTAQHLLKTVTAARLMGAECIISGIRPQIAQTIVHLGVDLGEVPTKATLADAFRTALQRTGMALVSRTGR
jgi:rsbT co-antagonist protein RsbR